MRRGLRSRGRRRARAQGASIARNHPCRPAWVPHTPLWGPSAARVEIPARAYRPPPRKNFVVRTPTRLTCCPSSGKYGGPVPHQIAKALNARGITTPRGGVRQIRQQRAGTGFDRTRRSRRRDASSKIVIETTGTIHAGGGGGSRPPRSVHCRRGRDTGARTAAVQKNSVGPAAPSGEKILAQSATPYAYAAPRAPAAKFGKCRGMAIDPPLAENMPTTRSYSPRTCQQAWLARFAAL